MQAIVLTKNDVDIPQEFHECPKSVRSWKNIAFVAPDPIIGPNFGYSMEILRYVSGDLRVLFLDKEISKRSFFHILVDLRRNLTRYLQ